MGKTTTVGKLAGKLKEQGEKLNLCRCGYFPVQQQVISAQRVGGTVRELTVIGGNDKRGGQIRDLWFMGHVNRLKAKA